MKRFMLAALLSLTATAFGQVSGPAPSDPASAEARAGDIEIFRTQVLARDRSYPASARALAERRLAQLESRRAAVSQAYFELELARIAALADNAHSSFVPSVRSMRYNRVPLRLVPFGEDFYVLRATVELADLLGARLVSIDDVPIARLRAAARALVGGPPNWRDRNAGYLFESPEQLHALGLSRRANAATYRLRLEDGSTIERRLEAEARDPARPRGNAIRWLSPEPAEGEGDRWRTLLPVDRLPWSLREARVPFRMRELAELDAFVVQLRQNTSSPGADIGAFLTSVEEAIRSSGSRNLVLDMRLNGGGDLNTTRAFMQRLPDLVPGRIFVLTGPWTFSAAISSIGYLEQAAPSRVTIVGEEVGDRLVFFSEGGVTTLPNSGAAIFVSTERHDYRNGCRSFADCHGPVVRNPIAVESLAPDIFAPLTIDAYRDGRDPAMEAVAAALRAAEPRVRWRGPVREARAGGQWPRTAR